jgi:hypothetical protein
VGTFCTSKTIELMPRPSKRASHAKAQRLPGNLAFTKIIEEEEGSEWEEESESKSDDDDEYKDAQSRMRKLYSLSLPKAVMVDNHHQV